MMSSNDSAPVSLLILDFLTLIFERGSDANPAILSLEYQGKKVENQE